MDFQSGVRKSCNKTLSLFQIDSYNILIRRIASNAGGGCCYENKKAGF